MIFQYAIDIHDVRKLQEVQDLLNFVSSERREKIKRFCYEKDRIRSLFAEVLLRYALRDRYNINDPRIGQDIFGKPCLLNYPECFFNLSHSGDWVVCGLGDHNLGIDVEKIEDIDLSIANDCFSMEEVYYLSSLAKEERLSSFYTIWTLKESYIKTDGRGLGIPLNSFSLILNNGRYDLFLQGKYEKKYQFHTLDLGTNHKMSICVEVGDVNISFEDLSVISIEHIRHREYHD